MGHIEETHVQRRLGGWGDGPPEPRNARGPENRQGKLPLEPPVGRQPC